MAFVEKIQNRCILQEAALQESPLEMGFEADPHPRHLDEASETGGPLASFFPTPTYPGKQFFRKLFQEKTNSNKNTACLPLALFDDIMPVTIQF